MLVQGAVTKDHLRLLESHSRDYLACFSDDCDHDVFLPLINWTERIKNLLMFEPRTQRLAAQVTGTEIMQEAMVGARAVLGTLGLLFQQEE